MNDEAARAGGHVTIAYLDRKRSREDVGEALLRLAVEMAAVDRAARVRLRAAMRDESPFCVPASVADQLGLAA